MNRRDRRSSKPSDAVLCKGIPKDALDIAKRMDARFVTWMRAFDEPSTRLHKSMMGSVLLQHAVVMLLRSGLAPNAIIDAITHHANSDKASPFLLIPEDLIEASAMTPIDEEKKN